MTLLQIAADAVSEITSSSTEGDVSVILKTLKKFSLRFIIDFASVFVLIRFVYYRVYRRSELFFTFFIFNLVIFLICFLLNKVELSMGAAFGLFAVFSMLRYRTEDISIKDMSYLFLVIAIGLISAVTKIKDASDVYEYAFLGIINILIILVALAFESNVFFKKEEVKTILYENIDLIKAEKQAELLADLRNRTGLNIHRISIGKIDFLKDAAVIKAYYFEEK